MRTRFVDIDDRMEDLADRMRADPELGEDFYCAVRAVVALPRERARGRRLHRARSSRPRSRTPPLADATFVGALREIRNHKIAIDLVREEAKAKKLRVNLTLVKKLYETLGAGIESRSVAEFRKDMPLHRAYFHEIAQPAKIPALLQKVLESCDSADFRNAHPVQRAAKLHHGFMQVFPFTENSGRVARLLGEPRPAPGRVPAAVHHPRDRPAAVLRVAPGARDDAARPHHRGARQRAEPGREVLPRDARPDAQGGALDHPRRRRTPRRGARVRARAHPEDPSFGGSAVRSRRPSDARLAGTWRGSARHYSRFRRASRPVTPERGGVGAGYCIGLPPMLLGAHEGIAGGVSTAFARAEADGADCLQIFTRNARGWAAKPLDDGEVDAFRSEARRTGQARGRPLLLPHQLRLARTATSGRRAGRRSPTSSTAASGSGSPHSSSTRGATSARRRASGSWGRR